jgi:hypothetical protein
MQKTVFKSTEGRRTSCLIIQMSTELSFLQINLQHSKAATQILSGLWGKRKQSLIWELWAFKGRVKHFGGYCTLFYYAPVEKPRPYVYTYCIDATTILAVCSTGTVAVLVMYMFYGESRKMGECSCILAL